MQSVLDNYGTHYVSTVFWGGLGECEAPACLPPARPPTRLPALPACWQSAQHTQRDPMRRFPPSKLTHAAVPAGPALCRAILQLL